MRRRRRRATPHRSADCPIATAAAALRQSWRCRPAAMPAPPRMANIHNPLQHESRDGAGRLDDQAAVDFVDPVFVYEKFVGARHAAASGSAASIRAIKASAMNQPSTATSTASMLRINSRLLLAASTVCGRRPGRESAEAACADPSASDGEQGQDHQRPKHRPGAFMRRVAWSGFERKLGVGARMYRCAVIVHCRGSRP